MILEDHYTQEELPFAPREPRLIGLIGYARAGKDTVAGMMPGFERVGFADALKELLREIDPAVSVNRNMIPTRYSILLRTKGQDWVKDNTNARDYMVRLGRGVREVLGKDTWLNVGMAKADALLADGENVVITDVRYLNEAQAIVDRGGELWYIERDPEGAANEEEFRSIEEILDVLASDWKYVGNIGDLGRLRYNVERTISG